MHIPEYFLGKSELGNLSGSIIGKYGYLMLPDEP